MRFTESRRASGPSTRARPAGQAPQRNHVNPRENSTCVDPRRFVSVQFSRNRCRLAADSQSLADRFRSQELFFGAARRVASKGSFSVVFGICFLERAGPGIAGGGEDTEVPSECQALSREKVEKFLRGVPPRPRSRRPGGTPPAERPGRQDPSSLSGTRGSTAARTVTGGWRGG